jgi:hypothetical protein
VRPEFGAALRPEWLLKLGANVLPKSFRHFAQL